MTTELLRTITADESEVRDRSLDVLCQGASARELLQACNELDRFRRASDNLYERVRALFFLSAIYRYHLPERLPPTAFGLVPFEMDSGWAGNSSLLFDRDTNLEIKCLPANRFWTLQKDLNGRNVQRQVRRPR